MAAAWVRKSLRQAQGSSAPALFALSGLAPFLGPSISPSGSQCFLPFWLVVILVVVVEVGHMWQYQSRGQRSTLGPPLWVSPFIFIF